MIALAFTPILQGGLHIETLAEQAGIRVRLPVRDGSMLSALMRRLRSQTPPAEQWILLNRHGVTLPDGRHILLGDIQRVDDAGAIHTAQRIHPLPATLTPEERATLRALFREQIARVRAHQQLRQHLLRR